MSQEEFDRTVLKIGEKFQFLVQKGFQLESRYHGLQDNIITLSSDYCQVAFVEDRGEVFLFVQPVFLDMQENPLRFEMEVIIALLTDFKKVIRGTKRVVQDKDNQIDLLQEIFLLYQEEILDLFLPENYPTSRMKLQKAKKEIDLLYIDYIRNKAKHKR